MKYIKIIRFIMVTIYCGMLVSPVSIAANTQVDIGQVHSASPHVNINTATAQEMANKLNGVGLSKAQRIVEYREKYGPFVVIEQLKEVSGIGQSILDKNSVILTL